MMNLMIIDDHLLIRAGIKLLLKNAREYRVTAEAGSAEEALALLRETPVDLVILDISMPGMGGLAAIRAIGAQYPTVKILVLSMHEDEEYIYKAMQSGAMGISQRPPRTTNSSTPCAPSPRDAATSARTHSSRSSLPCSAAPGTPSKTRAHVSPSAKKRCSTASSAATQSPRPQSSST